MMLVAVLAASLAAASGATTAPGPVCDAIWHDAGRDRDLPVRILMPAGTGRVPLVLFSPGLGGNLGAGGLLTRGWAARGIAVIQLQHPGSDSAIYSGSLTAEQRATRVRAAATPQQLLARVGDMRFVLDEVGRRPQQGDCRLQRIDPDRIGAAGHSMGAWTVHALAGQRWGAGTLADRRIRAIVALSPSTPFVSDTATAFGRIGLPVLTITGTLDGAPATASPELRAAALADRTRAHDAMPAGDKTLLVFADGDHMAFSGTARSPAQPADSHIQAVMLAATSAFWRAHLQGDARAGAWLQSSTGLAALLAPGDRLAQK